MTLKKFLSAILIGAFIAGAPTFTQTVSAEPSIQPLGYALFAKKKAELEAELNRLRLNYENARQKYETARKSGKYSKAELKKLETEYLKAKEDYERQSAIIKKEQEKLKETEKASTDSNKPTPKFNGLG